MSSLSSSSRLRAVTLLTFKHVCLTPTPAYHSFLFGLVSRSSFVDETLFQSNIISGLDFGFDTDAKRSVSGGSTTAVVGLVSSSKVAQKDLDGEPETSDHSFIDDQASLLS